MGWTLNFTQLTTVTRGPICHSLDPTCHSLFFIFLLFVVPYLLQGRQAKTSTPRAPLAPAALVARFWCRAAARPYTLRRSPLPHQLLASSSSSPAAACRAAPLAAAGPAARPCKPLDTADHSCRTHRSPPVPPRRPRLARAAPLAAVAPRRSPCKLRHSPLPHQPLASSSISPAAAAVARAYRRAPNRERREGTGTKGFDSSPRFGGMRRIRIRGYILFWMNPTRIISNQTLYKPPNQTHAYIPHSNPFEGPLMPSVWSARLLQIQTSTHILELCMMSWIHA
jgi:hypothetical protein